MYKILTILCFFIESHILLQCFFVIADGIITGAGETRSTPDIIVDMMTLDPAMANPKPASYLAIADGEKQLNMAKVVSINKYVDKFNYRLRIFI